MRYRNGRHVPAGGLGDRVLFNTMRQEQHDQFIKVMWAENVSVKPMRGDAILPVTVGRGKTIQDGASACPRTIGIWNRGSGIPMDPKSSGQDLADIIAAVRKVYPTVRSA